jgi:hypothetical protein
MLKEGPWGSASGQNIIEMIHIRPQDTEEKLLCVIALNKKSILLFLSRVIALDCECFVVVPELLAFLALQRILQASGQLRRTSIAQVCEVVSSITRKAILVRQVHGRSCANETV